MKHSSESSLKVISSSLKTQIENLIKEKPFQPDIECREFFPAIPKDEASLLPKVGINVL